MSTSVQSRTTSAFYVQAILAFALSSVALVVGIISLPVGAWIRGFLGLGLLYVVTSAFTLAKTIRDRHESADMISRVDQVRLEKLLAEHNPYKAEGS
jgi:hypothetical protein